MLQEGSLEANHTFKGVVDVTGANLGVHYDMYTTPDRLQARADMLLRNGGLHSNLGSHTYMLACRLVPVRVIETAQALLACPMLYCAFHAGAAAQCAGVLTNMYMRASKS